MREHCLAQAKSQNERQRDEQARLFQRYMHLSDCSLVYSVWSPKWALCPVCGGHFSREGVMQHRSQVVS